MRSNKLIYPLILLLAISIWSCKPKKEDGSPFSINSQNGIFVVNEGSFLNANSSLSFFDRNNKLIYNDIFSQVNGRGLGDVAQSMTVNNGIGYIVVNNSNKVEIVNANNMKSITTINDVILPRHLTTIDNSKGYLTEWISDSNTTKGYVKVINLSSNTITTSIKVGIHPETMLFIGGKLYVTNSGDSTLFVIDTSTDKVVDTIKVGDNPNSIVKDMNNNIWVLCGGNKVYNSDWSMDLSKSTAGRLIKMDASGNIQLNLAFSDKGQSPSSLSINSAGDTLYYNNDYLGSIYSFTIQSSSLNTVPFINGSFYGLGVDPINNYILGGVAKSFTQTGYFYRYTPAGALVDSFNVGIAPNGFAFN